jgi:O-antigen/teichoic acid export membrane protein
MTTTSAPPTDKHRRLAHNVAAGGVTNFVKMGLQLLMMPLLARLIGPSQFGLYALAFPTISFFTVLADGGLGASLAREDERSTTVWSTAFWTTLAVCSLIALGVTAGGFALGKISGQTQLAGIMAFLSSSFVLLALSVLPAARLVRRGNLVVHSAADFVGAVVSAVIALSLALAGAGAWALAAQYVVAFAIRTVILNYAAFSVPSFEFRLSALWPHIATGSSLIGGRLSDFAGRLIENLIFGGIFGQSALGNYTFANQSTRFLCESASNPIWGALYSHAVLEDVRSVERLHGKLSRLLAMALFPAAALLAAAAPQIVRVVLGNKWSEAAPLLQIIVPFYAFYTVSAQNSAILLANGRNITLFWTSAASSVCRVAAVSAAPWIGVVGVAWGIGGACLFYAAIIFFSITRTAGYKAWPILRGLVAPALSSLAAGVLCHVLLAVRGDDLLWLLSCLGAGGCAFVVCMFALERRELIADALAIRRILFART